MINKILFLFCLTVFTFCVSFFNEIKDIFFVKRLQERIVYLDFLGGLGNQMFEFSYAHAYAKKHDKILCYSNKNLIDDLFYMPPTNENCQFDVDNEMTGTETYYFEYQDSREIKDVFENKNIFYLNGFFQDSSL